MADVLTVVAKIRAAKGKGDALAALLKEQVAAVRKAEPGCLIYRPHRSTKDPDLFIFYEQYKDDAAFDLHRKAGLTTTDAVYPFARDHLHFAEQITGEGLAPHKVRELWYWGADEPDIIVDVTDSIDRQIAGLIRHESQVPGFNVPEGHTIGERVKKNAAEHAEGYGFQYGAVFRRLMARR